MKTVSVKISDRLDAELSAVARRGATAKSAVLRSAIEAYLANEPQVSGKSFAELAKDLIGKFPSGISDLAHNPKHMKGFGR